MESTLFRTARKLIGISLIAFGFQQFLTGRIVAGRPPAWPTSIPGELVVAYLFAALLILTGICILINKKMNMLLPTAFFIIGYCVLRNLYVILWENDIGISLTNFGKGITLASGLLLINATRSDESGLGVHKSIDKVFILSCYCCIGFFLFASGIQHFIFADFVKFLVPQWIPFPLFWTYSTGVALAIAGLSIISGFKRQLFATWSALVIFIWVIVLHIPRALQTMSDQNEWTAVFEAITFSSLLFVISRISSPTSIENFDSRRSS